MSLFRRELSISTIRRTVLGRDPPTVNRLNGESFQQDALVTFNGYQYAVFYGSDATATATTPRHVSVARRSLASLASQAQWETLTLTDYNQTDDDGHDIISLGICSKDGTLHIAFDQHDNDLNYRISRKGVATNPSGVKWGPELFGSIQNFLPGLETINRSEHFENVTYPRFLSIPSGNMLLEMRVGRSGLGDDWLYEYDGQVGKWKEIGKYLEGVQNNAYINGFDIDNKGVLQVSWTYRDFINDTGQDVAVEAGPNGPENNHDMDFGYSMDLGITWQNNWGQTIANMTSSEPIFPNSAGITIFGIPKYGGILNQEAQTVDDQRRIHVLNRENTTGTELWYHYWRSTTKDWTRSPFLDLSVTPTVLGKRGKLAAYHDNLIAILPDNAPNSTRLQLLGSTAQGHFSDWSVLWDGVGNGWEPLLDRTRLNEGVLSMLIVNGTQVEVVDFELSD
ncbi:hypothetical protein M422DRAFT_185901 [Sphaerobolus stellatus SS14]|uniref:Unplaced genomic scaffold SPHSTscaffold_167, whole genome shotgun sequence n=1 Tax=Sphaerobolus stellatus (strain SS14) TaxID=990650 RepID=A0A0C9UA94_SPHS4|nr:hypothetical protein M422DRAFT_185901 [Sphaerobolus stellatus SS14]